MTSSARASWRTSTSELPVSSKTATAGTRCGPSRGRAANGGSGSSGRTRRSGIGLDARGRIEAVERLEGERETVTVVEEYARATPGRVLPARRPTIARDRLTGACLARELLVEAHCRIEHVWLPTCWDVSVETTADSRACRIELFAHQLP